MNGFYTLYHIVSCWLILYGIWPCNFWGYPIWTWVILVRKGRTHKSKMLRAVVLISGEKNLDSFFAYFADGRRFNRLYIDRYSYYMFNMSRDFSAVTERTYHPAWWACRLAAHPQRMTSCRLRLMAQIDEEWRCGSGFDVPWCAAPCTWKWTTVSSLTGRAAQGRASSQAVTDGDEDGAG